MAERAVGAGLLRALLARPRWLAATALAIAGWPLQVAALALAPLTVVQPALALGLVVLLVLGRRLLGEPVRPRDFVAVAAIAAGLALLAVVRAGQPSTCTPSAATLVAVLGGLGLIASRRGCAAGCRAAALVVAAGCAYAASGLTTSCWPTRSGGALAAILGWAAASAAAAGRAAWSTRWARCSASARPAWPRARSPCRPASPWSSRPLLGEHWGTRCRSSWAGSRSSSAASLVLGAARAVTGLVSAAHE